MRFNNIFITCMLFGLSFSGYSQQTQPIQGQITGSDGQALPGVAVYLKGTSFVATTDADGLYRLSPIESGEYTIVFQLINYLSKEQRINLVAGRMLQVDQQLTPDPRQLDEVLVKDKKAGDKLKESAKAVDIIQTRELKLKSADLSEVLAQAKGVNVRRGGGLGSEARFSLNGLTDDQIKFFLDEVPMAFAGYGFGFANIPVNLVERVEIYKGVVPIRFGADALGGAVNIVTPAFATGTHLSASYQAGSFQTHRLALSGQHQTVAGFFVRAAVFHDYSKNNYKVDVQMADDKGRLSDFTVRRFHDAYKATGINTEVGIKNKAWAKELSLKLFASDFRKALQNNNVMTVPYGEVEYGEQSKGVSLRYKQNLSRKIGLDYVMGYSNSKTQFTDSSHYVYNWLGQKVAERVKTGEINNASNQYLWEKSGYARLNLEYILSANHILRASVAPTYVHRTGDETLQTNPGGRDPLSAQRDLLTLVNGLEYELNAGTKWQNMLFAKQYIQNQRSEEVLPGGRFRRRDRSSTYYGFGTGLRYLASETLRLKTSYEWATRLPGPDEIFGDGALVLPNLFLSPERSHNINLEAALTNKVDAKSKWNASVNLFLRAANDLILMLGTDKLFGYQNVFNALSKGVELAGGWASANNRLTVDANYTWQDFRNVSGSGSFAAYKNDRIPNTPYSIANANMAYNLPRAFGAQDALSFFWNGRYIHSFYRGWESAGLKEFKQVIPTQLVNNIGFTYKLPYKKISNALTGEVQNLANARIYDNFGVQKPGRAFYLKVVFEI